jgi:hypothetical protein
LSTLVQRASTKALFEPVVTRRQWKGEAAASFVCAGITSSRMLPTSSVGYWYPLILVRLQAPPRRRFPSGAIILPRTHFLNIPEFIVKRITVSIASEHALLRPGPFAVCSHYGSLHGARIRVEGQRHGCYRWGHPYPGRLWIELSGVISAYAASGRRTGDAGRNRHHT